MTDVVANLIIRGDSDEAVKALNSVKSATEGIGKTATASQESFKGLLGIISPVGLSVAGAASIELFVKPTNAAELMSVPNVNGALVGGASLKAVDFIGIIKAYL